MVIQTYKNTNGSIKWNDAKYINTKGSSLTG